MSIYDTVYADSLREPERFWAAAADHIHWDRKWDRVRDDSRAPFYRWFVGGILNTCYNALDLHIERGRGKQLALIYDSPVTNTIQSFTYLRLRDEVARVADGLRRQGIEKGDRVIIYMPMVPEAVIAMLACARIGAIHSVVFGGFASRELATRIDDAKPKLILSASCGIEVNRVVPYKPLLDEAIRIARCKPERCIILQRPQQAASLVAGRDLDWEEAMAKAEAVDCVPVAATDPLYILYTSGTTGVPKGVLRDNGGHAVALRWSMEYVYGIGAGEVFWAASDIGWVVGHSYIVYGPLLLGATTILYERKPVGTPDPGAFWRVTEQHGVNAIFTAPTAFRAIRKEDPRGEHISRHDLSRFRTLFLAGERCDPDTLLWAQAKLGVPVIDHWWQTETGWAIAANCVGLGILPVKPGSPTKPVPGYDVRVLGEDRHEMPSGQIGTIVIKLPMLPGCFPTLWNNDTGFEQSYLSKYPGYYLTGDAGYEGRRRVRAHHESGRRHHQCCGTPLVDRRYGGGARLPSGRGRVCGGRGRGRPQGGGTRWLRRDQGRRHPPRSGNRQRACGGRSSGDRAGGRVQDGDGRRAAPQDALWQDPARDNQKNCGWCGVHGPGNHRRSGHLGRDH